MGAFCFMQYLFKITSHLRGIARRTVRTEIQTPAHRQTICEACEWYQSAVSRCTRPNDKRWSVCYRSNARVRPWIGIRACEQWMRKSPSKTGA